MLICRTAFPRFPLLGGAAQRPGRRPAGHSSRKTAFGAFHGTDLELILRSRGVDTIIIAGIATYVCCETTAREATLRDFRVFFLSDGTTTFDIGDVSAAGLKQATCATLGFRFAQVLAVDEMMRTILPPARAKPPRKRASRKGRVLPNQRLSNNLSCTTWDGHYRSNHHQNLPLPKPVCVDDLRHLQKLRSLKINNLRKLKVRNCETQANALDSVPSYIFKLSPFASLRVPLHEGTRSPYKVSLRSRTPDAVWAQYSA